MFTGIIESIGTVLKVTALSKDKEFVVSAPFCSEIKIGDSISINGACQTVTSFNDNSFSFFSSMETLSLTNLGNLKAGDSVNLERALKLSSRLDGHIVSGHVDGIAKIISISRGGESIRYTFELLNDELIKYVAKKGSIAVDGISLTVFDVRLKQFECAIIPITIEDTILKNKKIGEIVNIETDVLAKYVEKLLNQDESKGITLDFLKEHGF